MAKDPIIFGLANPIPEVMPDIAKKAGAAIVATGRSDMPNQVNNSLVFPGIFRGALDAQVANITDEMKIAAAHAIAKLVTDDQLDHNYINPKSTDYAVAPAVAEAVARRSNRKPTTSARSHPSLESIPVQQLCEGPVSVETRRVRIAGEADDPANRLFATVSGGDARSCSSPFAIAPTNTWIERCQRVSQRFASRPRL